MHGSWRPLAVFAEDKPDKTGSHPDSHVDFAADRMTWLDRDGKELMAGQFTVSELTEVKGKATVKIPAFDLTTGSATCPGIYDVYLPNFLRITFRHIKPELGRPSVHTGGGTTTFFLLERISGQKPRPIDTSRTDQERLVGTWSMLISFDDAADKIPPGPSAGQVCVITKERIEWRESPKHPGFRVAADYTIDPTTTPKQMDWQNAKGGNPAPPEDGYLPAIYEFIDEDTLKVCYPESGFKATTPPKERARPTRFQSDGNINLWIMKRQ
ncbi:hypothetical protein LBMAG53_34940 [Planctomycetota bacterium]|nr:hypothetical protein LBMAG53_34940 [Planctomycetota bacterium]